MKSDRKRRTPNAGSKLYRLIGRYHFVSIAIDTDSKEWGKNRASSIHNFSLLLIVNAWPPSLPICILLADVLHELTSIAIECVADATHSRCQHYFYNRFNGSYERS